MPWIRNPHPPVQYDGWKAVGTPVSSAPPPPPVQYDGWEAVGAPVTSAPWPGLLPQGRVGWCGLCGGRGLHLTGPGVEGDKAGPPTLGVGGLQAQPQPL